MPVYQSVHATQRETGGKREKGGGGAEGVLFCTARLKLSDYTIPRMRQHLATRLYLVCDSILQRALSIFFHFQRLAHTQSGNNTRSTRTVAVAQVLYC